MLHGGVPDLPVISHNSTENLPKISTAGGKVVPSGMGGVDWQFADTKGKPLKVKVGTAMNLEGAERLFSVYSSVQQGATVVFSAERSYIRFKGGREVDFVVQNKYWLIPLHAATEDAAEAFMWKRTVVNPGIRLRNEKTTYRRRLCTPRKPPYLYGQVAII